MGLPAGPTEPPYEYGDDCNNLIPELWPAGQVPKYITAIFTGIELCPLFIGTPADPIPNDEPFILTQDAINPCRWFRLDVSWSIEFIYSAGPPEKTYLTLLNRALINLAFLGWDIDITKTAWPNLATCAGGHVGQSGSGRIY